MKKGVSVIIVTWNGLALLKQALDSVIEASKTFAGDSEVIVVDNGSQDRTVDVLRDFYPSVKVVALPENLGFSKGNNEGAKIAAYDKIFFVNNDVKLSPDCLNLLCAEFEKLATSEDVFSLTPQVNFWRNGELTDDVFSTAIAFDLSSGEITQKFAVNDYRATISGTRPTVYGSGAVLLCDTKKFLDLGGFPEIYTPAYWEDFDLCYHAWKRGWGSYFTSKVIAWHQISATSASLDSSFKSKLMLRNFFIFNLLNFDSKEYLRGFMLKSFLFSLALLFKGKTDGKVFFQVLLKYGKEILRERSNREKHYKLDDRDVFAKTWITEKSWVSPPMLTYTVDDVLNALMND